ncbi:isoaspartyl peptidase/L-asparaginase [Tahibacter amnicola]|uniref:Isoaspartyl peptidase/L-asparaginase n=2 Tax=Tahibacter amnicola TaxID=2976241 RepID=A0ABY6BL43_9GAMM|nr:isoaspartyl peptidase/L-asparaginase [Tahibacter amnicola]UXI70743.1 isoaspartyl peptidase/L-asparaginase [Tahibacter amnicola]
MAAGAAEVKPVLVIHGGAGVMKKSLAPERRKAIETALHEALSAGYGVLKDGGSSLEAATAAVVVLEDSPYFNAGKGAVFNHDGKNELDASVMDGATRRAGSVAGLHRVKNPVRLARAVMEKSAHVMLVGDGAEAFAKDAGIELVDPSYFRTEERWNQLQEALKAEAANKIAELPAALRHGTVGAVALDKDGHLAAATSTGGMTNKRWGRIGDSPVIGAGTYANADCAASGTGWGEYFIRTVATHSICSRVAAGSDSVGSAATAVLKDIETLGGDGGVIVLDAKGNFATPFNTEGMFRGWVDRDGKFHVAILPGE